MSSIGVSAVRLIDGSGDPLDDDNNVDCELPDWTHDDIMSIALDDAGVASRDQSLIQLNQASKVNLTPPQ